MFPHFRQPPLQTFEATSLCYIIHKQHSYGLSVVSIRDRAVPLLPRCVPYLCPNVCTFFDFDLLSGELHADGRLGFCFELVFGVSQEELRFADAGVAY